MNNSQAKSATITFHRIGYHFYFTSAAAATTKVNNGFWSLMMFGGIMRLQTVQPKAIFTTDRNESMWYMSTTKQK